MKKSYLLALGMACWIFVGLSETIEAAVPGNRGLMKELQWSKEDRLTVNQLEDSSLSIIQDAEGTLWAVWATETYTGEDILYRTFDGEWSKGMTVTSIGLDDSSPSIIQDADGTIWVVWTSSRSHDWEIYCKTFDGTWSGSTKLTENPGDDVNPTIFQDATGKIWVAWSSFRGDYYHIYYKTFDGEWSDDIQLTDAHGDDFNPTIIQDADGTIWVFWESAVVDNMEIYCKKTSDGYTWSEDELLATNRQIEMSYSVLQDTTGTIWVVWDFLHDNYDIYYKTFDGEWSDNEQLTNTPGHDHNPSIMQDANGTVWVVWDSEREFGNRDIYYKTFDGEWSDDIQLTEHSGKDWSPQIIQDSSGTIWIFWDSERDGNQDIYYMMGTFVSWWVAPEILAIFLIGLLVSSSYGWYKKFPVSFNRFSWVITGGKLVPFMEINPNPYIAGNPIRSREMFFGREDVFEFLDTKLEQGVDVAIVLHGQRRTGKTSILYQIKEGRLGPQFIPVFIDIQEMVVNNDKEFLQKIAKKMVEGLKDCEPESFYSLKEFLETNWNENNPYDTFEEFLDICSTLIGGRCFLIMVDEYDLLAEKIEKKILRSEITGFLRSWMQLKSQFSFVFAGTRELEKTKPFWPLLFDSAIYRKISTLKKEDAITLMKKPVRGLIHYDSDATEQILRLTSCHPYFLQLMLQKFVDHINERRHYRIGSEDVDEVVSDLMRHPPSHFNYLWVNSSLQERKVLSAMASFPIESMEIPLQEIYAKLSQINIEDTTVKGILEKLVEKDILEISKSGEIFLFRLELYRRWIASKHPFLRIREEIE